MIPNYAVFSKNDVFVGYTTNEAEARQYLATHPGSRYSRADDTQMESSTLPHIAETMPRPKGDLLQQ